ncbi:hypothetical protein BKA67DRAFT_671885 [Truncatella angustata]|uniref:Uncharacterized protein n=1 Tax=Truncatella angustata TaxID=152316 RepID=A0A9P8RJL8_9PEZI|nr:uncharacterized protein BKA67DRAFT_671885 [Truncatella angustata]KAH6638687.1 hypothetical protein BKA67DRAFT_671885 [Truncatella angustata]
MPRGTSIITDQRYYAVNRTEFSGNATSRVAVEDCDRLLQSAPTPKADLKPRGRRPHLHKDDEGHYAHELILLDPRTHHETSQVAVVRVEGLPKLAAYPDRSFDYAGQNRKGRDGKGDAAYGRIITDSHRTQIGMSYHPYGNKEIMVRAEAKGVFIADYRRDSIGNEAIQQKVSSTGNRSTTWPRH